MRESTLADGEICLLCNHVFSGENYRLLAEKHGEIPVTGTEHHVGEVFLTMRLPYNNGKGFVVVASEAEFNPDHVRRYLCLGYVPHQNVPGAVRPNNSPFLASPTLELSIEELSQMQFQRFLTGMMKKLDAHYTGRGDGSYLTSLEHLHSFYPDINSNPDSPRLVRGVLPR